MVAYNSADLLGGCVEPLRDAVAGGTVELIVVDNCSADDPQAALEATGIGHRFIRSEINGGFAHGVNLAAANAVGDYLLLLNPDVTFEPAVLGALLSKMDAEPSIAAIGPLLVTEGVLTANGGRLPGARAMFAHTSGLARILRNRHATIGHYAYTNPGSGDLDVEWLSGGFLLLRRAAAPAGALLSERWFMYAEDIDLCVYLGRAGRLVLATDVQAHHAIGGSSAGDESPRTMWVAALEDFYRTTMARSWFSVAAWRASFALGFYLRAAHMLVKRNPRRARSMAAFARSALATSAVDAARINRGVQPVSAVR